MLYVSVVGKLNLKTGLCRSFGQKSRISSCMVSLTEGESRFSPATLTATIHSAPAQAAKLFNRPESRPRGTGSGIPQAADFWATWHHRWAHAGLTFKKHVLNILDSWQRLRFWFVLCLPNRNVTDWWCAKRPGGNLSSCPKWVSTWDLNTLRG